MFDKFLGNQPPEPEPEKFRRYPKRYTEKHGSNGRLLRKFVKSKWVAGGNHWKVKRKNYRESSRKKRATPKGAAYVRQYNGSLRRKYVQSRSFCRRYAERHGIDPDTWFQVTFEDWTELWTTTEDVFVPDKGFVTAVACQGQPFYPWKTWCSRLDFEKPWTRDNIVVRFSGPKGRHQTAEAPTLKNRLSLNRK